MADITETTNVTGGSSIDAAADAFQSLLTPERDHDEDDTEAQQGKKPTGKRAKAKPEEDDQEDPDAGDGNQEDQDDDEGEGEDGDQGDEPQEGDPEEGDPESDEQEDDGDEPDLTQTFTVANGDGTEDEVTLEELVKGYFRQKDYTRKTQAAAEERRQVATEKAEVSAMRRQYAQGLQQLTETIKQVAPQEPDWDSLRTNDAIEYGRQWADWQRQQQVLANIDYERRQVALQEQHEQQVAHAERVRAGREWLKAQIPSWKDPERAKADRSAMRTFGEKLGFTAEELQNVDDPRAVLLLHRAMQFERLQAKKQVLIKPVKKPSTPQKTPVLKPGAVKGAKAKQVSDLTRAKQRLAKTGTVQDAADVFHSIITGG